MNTKVIVLLAFVVGCATSKLVEFVSFKDAVARTGSNSHQTI